MYKTIAILVTTTILLSAEGIKELSDENFEKETQFGVTLVDFFAEWCGPCRMMTPVLEEVENEVKGQATIAKLDIDRFPAIADTYLVTGYPTCILFKDGKEIDRLIGYEDTEAIKNFILKVN